MRFQEFMHPGILTLQARVAKLARLMPGLPQFVEPLRLAETRETLSGEVPPGEMKRLAGILLEQGTPVRFSLEFLHDERGDPCIRGEFSTALTMRCQRCLEPVTLEVAGPIDVVLVTEEKDAERLPAGVEPVLLHDRKLQLAGFLEDEVLLALPFSPAHPAGECAAIEPGAKAAGSVSNPFSALADLKAGKRN